MKKLILILTSLFSTVAKPVQDREVIAAVIWAEARGEGLVGMRMVAEVIDNRIVWNGPRLLTPYEVVTKPKQFSCLNTWGAAKLVAFAKASTGPDKSAWEACLQLAGQLVDGTFENFGWAEGATHYHSVAVHPDWATEKQFITEYRNHIFYK